MSGVDAVKLLMAPLHDKYELQDWVLDNLGFELPGCLVSRFADCTPLDFVWEAYEAIMTGKPLAMMGLAGRDGVKTVGLSIIDLLAFLHDQREAIHVAMTSQQGGRAKAYLASYINHQPNLNNAVVKHNTREIKLNIDGEAVGMEILPATPKAVQGGHCSLLTFDELASSMEPNNVKAYRDAHGILGTSRKGKPAVVIKITSRQQGHSLAEQELKNVSKTGLKIRKWTTFENTERCPDSRSGQVPTPMWINRDKGETYSQAEVEGMDANKKVGLQRIDSTFDGCRKCMLAPLCQGDLKKQTSKSALLRTIDDVINKIALSGSWDWALAQIASLKPTTEGLIYWEFDRAVHVPGWDAMWHRLTGAMPTTKVGRYEFIAELKKRGAQFYGGIDWGFNPSPSVALVIAVDRRGYMYVVEAMAKIKMNDPEFIESVIRQDLQPRYDVQMWCPDLANASGRDILKGVAPTTDEIDKRIAFGVNLVKGCLRVPGQNGATRIFFAPDLDVGLPMAVSGSIEDGGKGRPIESIFEEFELYHKKTDKAGRVLDMEDPHDSFNHFLDALRYTIYWLVGRMRATMPGAESVQSQELTKATNIPSNTDILRDKGIPFIDNRAEVPAQPGIGPVGPGEAGGALWTWT